MPLPTRILPFAAMVILDTGLTTTNLPAQQRSPDSHQDLATVGIRFGTGEEHGDPRAAATQWIRSLLPKQDAVIPPVRR